MRRYPTALRRTFILLLVSLAFSANAGAQQRILLIDGTEIVGEVISLKNGSYTIRSNTLGTLTISDRQVRQISGMTSGSQPLSPLESAKDAMNSGQVQTIQQRLLGDGAMLQQIMALQSSKEMQAILSDPAIMSAIQNLDFETLKNNPKIIQLMKNQEVRAISQKVN